MAVDKVSYQRMVNGLVVEIAENFTSKDCEKLCFIYEDLIPASFRESCGENALRLLRRMRDERVFSNDRLDKLAMMMDDLKLPQLKSRVDEFVGELEQLFCMNNQSGVYAAPQIWLSIKQWVAGAACIQLQLVLLLWELASPVVLMFEFKERWGGNHRTSCNQS